MTDAGCHSEVSDVMSGEESLPYTYLQMRFLTFVQNDNTQILNPKS